MRRNLGSPACQMDILSRPRGWRAVDLHKFAMKSEMGAIDGKKQASRGFVYEERNRERSQAD